MGKSEKPEKTRKTTSGKSEKSAFFDPFLTPFFTPFFQSTGALFWGFFGDTVVFEHKVFKI
jgi:hypothetical protein